jgi:hypothetical protein
MVFGFMLFAVFAATVILAFINARSGSGTWAQTKQLLDAVIPVEASLLGAVVGYYFALERTSKG